MASKTTIMLSGSGTIDLTSPPDSNDSSSDFATKISPEQKLKPLDACNVLKRSIKNSIQHRQSQKLKKLTHKVIASVKSSSKVGKKKKSRKQKQKSACSGPNQKKKLKLNQKNISTQTQSWSATRIATAVATEEATTAFEIPVVSATPIQIPVANAFYVKQTPYTSPPPPSNRHFVAFHEALRALTERIALNPDNTCGVIDTSECNNRCCPYSSGNLILQRYNLMVRAFQINHLLSNNTHLYRSSLSASQNI